MAIRTVVKEGQSYYKYTCSFCGKDILAKKGEKDLIKTCPHCKNSSPWLLKPKTERILFELQEKYQKDLNQKAFEDYALEIKKPKSEQDSFIIHNHESNMNMKVLGEMYQIVQDYVGSLLKKFIKQKGFFLSHEEFLDKSYEVTFRWYEQTTKKPGFKIKDSWAGQLRWKIIEVLYDQSYIEEGQALSLDYEIDNFQGGQKSFINNRNLIPLFSSVSYTNPYETTIALSEELRKVLHLLIKSMNKISKQKSILSLLAFLFFIKKERRKENLLYANYGNEIKNDNEKIKLVLRRYLREIHV